MLNGMQEKLSNFADLPYYGNKIAALVNLAREENWDYRHDYASAKHIILINYINYTFQRLRFLSSSNQNGGYLYEDEESFCFNTGLFTKNFEPIFALFYAQRKKLAWCFENFYKESAYQLKKIPKLPLRASYFNDVNELIYNTEYDLRINIDHIITDPENQKRIPDAYRNAPILPMLFRSAIDYAKIRIQENYKAAVPQYYKNKVQFLLPISLGDPKIVDLSLAVARDNNTYTGRTCLTLDMAYNNARLIAKPESDWLVK